MDTSNAKMMLGYMDDDDDEILDYDGNLDLSTDNEDEDEAESVQEYTNVPQYPETPDEKIHWQEQMRMIHLRSHLNQLMEKVRHAHYITDKTREELKKCRGQIQQYEAEREQLFNEIRTKESEGNKSAVHRVRAAHQRICGELEGEQKLERMIIERLDQAEYDLAVAEVERGKFLLAEDDLLQREHKLSQEKTEMAMVRLAKEETLARQALTQRRKEDRTRRDANMEAERRHAQAIEEAERSHERANKYLQKTLDQLKQRENEEAERYKTDMSRKMDMLLKLKNDITHNRENLRAIRARDKATERKEKSAEMEERERIKLEGGNPEEMLLVKKRRNEVEKQRQQFEAEQKVRKASIMHKILQEEENMKKRRKQQPHLFDNPEREKNLRVRPHALKPVQALDDYVAATADESVDVVDPDKEQEMLMKKIKAKKKAETERLKNLSFSQLTCEPPKAAVELSDGEEESSVANHKWPSYEDVQQKSSSVSYMNDKAYKAMLNGLSDKMKRGIAIEWGFPEPAAFEAESDPLTKTDKALKSDIGINRNKNEDQSGAEGEEEVTLANLDTSDFLQDDSEDLLEQADMDDYDNGEVVEDLLEDQVVPDKDSDDSDLDEDAPAAIDLARPEFEGLWDKQTKPYRIPKDTDHASAKPIGGSKMDQEILKKTLEKTKEGIVITQMAAGRKFSGCPFYSKPDVIHFKDFVVGKTYKKKVTLTNVSYTVNYIKFLDITERLKDFVKIHFEPPGQMSAGLTCQMTVTFRPMINEDLEGQVNFITQTGPFHIPLICSTKKCDLVLDTKCIDFGTTVIGETLKRTFILENRGALSTKFDFFKVTGMKQRTLTTAGTSLGRMQSSEETGTLSDQLPLRVMSERMGSEEGSVAGDIAQLISAAPDAFGASQPGDTMAQAVSNGGLNTGPTNVKTTDSMRAVSPDSANDLEPGAAKTKATGSSVVVDSKKKSEEALDKIPEAGEPSVPPLDEVGQEGAAGTGGDETDVTAAEGTADESEQKQEGESEEAMSPDLAVSEMEEYGTLDGMRVGPVVSGEIGPFATQRLEIIWQPTLPGKVDTEFLVSFADPLSEPLSIRAVANAIDVPVWVERPTVELKICMYDRLYQDTIIINNRATTALRLKFEVCKELRNHLELLPKTGYIQAQSQFSAQLKFLPRQSLAAEASQYFDPETGVLEAPMTIRVADQTTPVHFTVHAVVTTTDLEFDVSHIDFGHCTIHESVRRTIKLTNHALVVQKFGFMGLPEYVEVQPNDGFGTLLPLETQELDVIFSPNKTREYKLDLVCRSLINREFKIAVCGVGVLTPLELTNQVVHFAATPLYDTSCAVLHVLNSHTSSNEFTHPVPRIGKGKICPVGPTSFEFVVPKDAPITVSPSVGTVKPGKACRVQVLFTPTLNDYDVRQEALRIHTRMEAAREERERLDAEARERREAEEKNSQSGSLLSKNLKKKRQQKDDQNLSLNSKNRSNSTDSSDLINSRSSLPIRLDFPLHGGGKPVRFSSEVDEIYGRPGMSRRQSRRLTEPRIHSQTRFSLNSEGKKVPTHGSRLSRSLSCHGQNAKGKLGPTHGPRRARSRVPHNERQGSHESHRERLGSQGYSLSPRESGHKTAGFSLELEFWDAEEISGFLHGRFSSRPLTTNCVRTDYSSSARLAQRSSGCDVSRTRSPIVERNASRNSSLPARGERATAVRKVTFCGFGTINDSSSDSYTGPCNGSANFSNSNINTNAGSDAGEDGDEDTILRDIRMDFGAEDGFDEEDEGEDAPAGKGKKGGKASPKGPQAKASKLSAAPSSSGSAITSDNTPRFDPDKLSRDSLEYQAAVTSLVRQYKGQFRSFTIPCYVASGETGKPGSLEYSIHNTLYLEVHCPAVRPPVVVISDSGNRVVDFGDVSIGQTCPRSVTIQNISEKDMELSATLTNPAGPFLMLNALRTLPPGSTHTLLLTFGPGQGQVFQEELGIKTFNSTLHLTLKGRGVNPLVNLSVEDNLYDMNAVLIGEFVERYFKVQNTSTLAIDYVIKQDSLSPLRHAKAQALPLFLNGDGSANYVGTQNDSGKNVFDIVPTKGSIPAGETKEIMVTFAPDHESDLYSDGVRLELFDHRCLPRGQEESHFFQVIGQAKPRVMFLEGVDPLQPTVESLALMPSQPEDDDAEKGRHSERAREGKSIVVSPPALVTIRSVADNDSFQPGVREIYAGCVRTMAVSQKKGQSIENGEFSVEGLQNLAQKGFTIEPQKGMVEAGTKKPIVITWTPPVGYDPSVTIEETAVLTLRCDVTEQITLMIRAMVVSE